MFEIIGFDPNIPLEEAKSDNGKVCHFRNWSFVKADDIKHINVLKRTEDGESFYVSSTEHYMPWWLKEENQPNMSPNVLPIGPKKNKNNKQIEILTSDQQQQPNETPPINHEQLNTTFVLHEHGDLIPLLSDLHMVNDASVVTQVHQEKPVSINVCLRITDSEHQEITDKNSHLTQTHPSATLSVIETNSNLLVVSQPGSASCSNQIPVDNFITSEISHLTIQLEKPNNALSTQSGNSSNINRSTQASHEHNQLLSNKTTHFSSLKSYQDLKYKQMIADCETIKQFVDQVLERDEYFNKKSEEKGKLTKAFEEAVINTEMEKMNLANKGIVNKRYVDIMKRLSMNSKNISDEAVLTRDHYNKNAKTYNETIQALKEIKMSENVQKALTNVLVFKETPKQIIVEPIYLTAKDLYDSKEYESVLKKKF